MLFTRDTINNAIKIIQTEPDNSNANKQARQLAKHHLLYVTGKLTDFANLKPNSDPAKYLFEECVRLRRIASQVGLPEPEPNTLK